MRLSRRLEIDIWDIVLKKCEAKAVKLFVNVVFCKNMKMVFNMKINMKLFCCLFFRGGGGGGLKLPAYPGDCGTD